MRGLREGHTASVKKGKAIVAVTLTEIRRAARPFNGAPAAMAAVAVG